MIENKYNQSEIDGFGFKRVLLPGRVPGVQFEQIHDLHEVQSMLAERVKTWTEEWKQQGLLEGIEQGLQEGRQKGIEQGRLEGEAKVLQKQLVRRFGALPEATLQRLHHATAEELDLWTDHILDAKSLEEVFSNP